MQKVRVCIELEDERYRSLASEANRREVTVSSLVERMVQGLLKDLEQQEREGTDHPITPS